MAYLPYGHFALAEFRGYDPLETEDSAFSFYRLLIAIMDRHPDLFCNTQLSEPAPSPIARVRKRYRFRILARDPSAQLLTQLFFYAADRVKRGKQQSLIIDIDPWSSL